MYRTCIRRNYFIDSNGCGFSVLVEDGTREKVTELCGHFERITEKYKRKLGKNQDKHWVAIEMDPDDIAPTKGLYLNADLFDAVSPLVSLARQGVILRQGDELSFSVKRNVPVLTVNGTLIKPNKKEEMAFFFQNSITEILDKVRGAHLDAEFDDEREYHYRIMVYNCIKEELSSVSDDALRRIASIMIPFEADPTISFEQIYKRLLKRFPDYKI